MGRLTVREYVEPCGQCVCSTLLLRQVALSNCRHSLQRPVQLHCTGDRMDACRRCRTFCTLIAQP